MKVKVERESKWNEKWAEHPGFVVKGFSGRKVSSAKEIQATTEGILLLLHAF